MRPPCGLVAEPRLRFGLQKGDRGRWQPMVSHVVVGRVVENIVGVSGAQQIEEVQPALRGPRAKPGEPFIADLRAKPVLPGMTRTGVVDADPGRCFQSRAQNILGFGNEPLVLVVQQANQLSLPSKHCLQMAYRQSLAHSTRPPRRNGSRVDGVSLGRWLSEVDAIMRGGSRCRLLKRVPTRYSRHSFQGNPARFWIRGTRWECVAPGPRITAPPTFLFRTT